MPRAPQGWVRGGGGPLAPQLPRAIRVGPNRGGNKLLYILGVYLLKFLGVYLFHFLGVYRLYILGVYT